MVTSVADSVAGTFSAKYSPDGQLVELKYPGGFTRTDRLDANRQSVERTYVRDSDGEAIYSESVVENTAGQWISHDYTGGSKSYSYDGLGRITNVQHDSDITAGCVTRTYSYDARTNRTGESMFAPDVDGNCNTDGVDSQANHVYDTADRLVDEGYVYDAFGRTKQLPGGVTAKYYVNDIGWGQALGDARQTVELDPTHRVRSSASQTLVNETLDDQVWVDTSLILNHYGDDSDEIRWAVEDGNIIRNVCGLDEDLAAITSATGDVQLQLTNLHGDVAATIDVESGTPELFDYDEFGVPLQGQTNLRYGWLGGKQRSSEALGDLMAMGVRLYNPTTGRFLQTDPVIDGSCNSYDYSCADPINKFDLDGRSWCSNWNWICRTQRRVRTVARYTWKAYTARHRNACGYGTSGVGCAGARKPMRQIGHRINRGFNRYYCNLGHGMVRWAATAITFTKRFARVGPLIWILDGYCLLLPKAGY